MLHLAVSGLATANLLMLDKLGGEMFCSSFCHTIEGRYGVTKKDIVYLPLGAS